MAALFRRYVPIPEIIQNIKEKIENGDLDIEQTISIDECQQINVGEQQFSDGIGGLLTQLADENIDFSYINHEDKTYNLLQYAIIMDRPNWVRQLLYFGAKTFPARSDDNYPNHGWGLYLDASDNIKNIFAEDEIKDIFGGKNQIESIQRAANERDNRVGNNP